MPARRNSGRKPTPTVVKRMRGNPGRRPIRDDLEPKPQPSLPTCPRELGTYARREWRRVAPELHKLGLLSQIDRAALAGYCSSYGGFIEAEGALRSDPDAETAKVLQQISRKSLEMMLRYLVEFGMSPSSRTRVRADIAAAARERPADEAFLTNRGLKLVT